MNISGGRRANDQAIGLALELSEGGIPVAWTVHLSSQRCFSFEFLIKADVKPPPRPARYEKV